MYKLEVRTYMRSAAWKSTGSLRAFRGQLLKIRIIPRGILRKVYSAIPHKNVSNLCQVPYYHEVVLYSVCSCWDWCCKHLTLHCAPFSSLSQVNGSVLVEGVMRIYWGLTKTITVAGGDQMYVGRQQGGYTKQEDLPDQWRREVRDIQEQRISRYLELVRTLTFLLML